MKGLRLQASLGRVQRNYRRDMDIDFLTLARVVGVNHKYGTADIITLNQNDGFLSNPGSEGKYSAKIVQNFANYDPERKKAWGSYSPISVGSIVLVAFLDKMKNRPIIIGQVHNPDELKNVLPMENMLERFAGFNRREALKSLEVYPSQAYRKIDGESNFEFVHASKSFLAMYNTYLEGDRDEYEAADFNDGHLSFDHEDLSEKDPITGMTLETDLEEAQAPPKLLYVHRTSFDNDETTWTKVYFDDQGMFRLTRDNRDDKLSFFEISSEGTIKLRRQNDDPNHNQGQDFSEILLEENGDAVIKRNFGKDFIELRVTKDGLKITHSTGSTFSIGRDMEFNVSGEVFSESLSKFIQKNHLVVSPNEPKSPMPYLVWIDTSDIE